MNIHNILTDIDLISFKTFLPFCFPLWVVPSDVRSALPCVHRWSITDVNKIHQVITQCCSCVKLHDTNVTLNKYDQYLQSHLCTWSIKMQIFGSVKGKACFNQRRTPLVQTPLTIWNIFFCPRVFGIKVIIFI